jgi:hypothetical protein
MKAAILAFMLLLAGVAHADSGTTSVVCDDRTKHPGVYPAGTPSCYCWDTCDGSSSAPAANTNATAAAAGAGKVLGAIFFTAAILILPGHASQLFAKDNKQPPQTKQQAQQAWVASQAKRKRLVYAGIDAKKARAAMFKLDDEERADLRDDPAPKVLKPFNPPKLVPDLHYRCDQAHMQIPSLHTSAPIGTFEDEEDMRGKCKAFADDPVDSDKVCSNPDLHHCAIADENNKEFCCPKSHPIFNHCDKQCYRNTDFNNAKYDEGFHCGTSRDCGAVIKP